jgi:hypothetical protein
VGAAGIETAMRAAFAEAEVDAAEVKRLEPAMTTDAKDRHVFTAAVAAGSELIVTFDPDDFRPGACEPLGVEAIHSDDFLLDLHDPLRAHTTAGVPRSGTRSGLGRGFVSVNVRGRSDHLRPTSAPRSVRGQ